MIKIDFSWAVTIFMMISCILVFVLWAFYTSKREEVVEGEMKQVQQCPYCTYIFFDYGSLTSITACPRCHSLIATQEDVSEKRGKIDESLS